MRGVGCMCMCDYGLDVKLFGISRDVDERMIMLQKGFGHTGNTYFLSFTPTTPPLPPLPAGFPEPLNLSWLLFETRESTSNGVLL